jgi:hypothetical protein
MLITAMNESGEAMPHFVTPDGQNRCLGAMPSGLMKAAAPLFATKNPVLPRQDWAPVRRNRGPVPVLNQGQFGDCTGFGSVTCVMRSRASAGQDFILLSPTFVYAQINGGFDRGSDPADAARTLVSTGTCTMAEFDESVIMRARIPATAYQTAKRFKTIKLYQCASFDEIVSAWLLGFDIFDTIAVGANFNTFDPDGVPGLSMGPGNHCVCTADELKRDSRGRWLLEHQNSWSTAWGNAGYFFTGEEQYANQYGWQAFAVQSVMLDPTDPLASLA